VGSTNPPASVRTSGSAAKYALGPGAATEGGRVGSIRPHQENTQKHNYNRVDWPLPPVPHDDTQQNVPRRKPVGTGSRSSGEESPRTRRESIRESLGSSQLNEGRPSRGDGSIDLRSAVMDGQQELEGYRNDVARGLHGVIDISNTIDVDKSTRVAPGVYFSSLSPLPVTAPLVSTVQKHGLTQH
jgi:hypothetical protein